MHADTNTHNGRKMKRDRWMRSFPFVWLHKRSLWAWPGLLQSKGRSKLYVLSGVVFRMFYVFFRPAVIVNIPFSMQCRFLFSALEMVFSQSIHLPISFFLPSTKNIVLSTTIKVCDRFRAASPTIFSPLFSYICWSYSCRHLCVCDTREWDGCLPPKTDNTDIHQCVYIERYKIYKAHPFHGGPINSAFRRYIIRMTAEIKRHTEKKKTVK